MKKLRRPQPHVPDVSLPGGPWYVGSFVIKKLESSYYAWSLDWDETTGLGVELGPFPKLDEAKAAAQAAS